MFSASCWFPSYLSSFLLIIVHQLTIVPSRPFGVSSCLDAALYGKEIDYNYKRIPQRLGLPVDRKKGDNLRRFPIERARLQTVFPVMAVGIAAFIPYGWVLQQRVNLAAPLVLQFIRGSALLRP